MSIYTYTATMKYYFIFKIKKKAKSTYDQAILPILLFKCSSYLFQDH